ncbi:uncharacterized protein YALI1_C17498g [Yarrowia lipolytica]|uniref:Uncharacterized protein n=1 Tax=Yarrowia lipolytica TaxID=4952 RepID=A0A1D8NAU4_YARLL|nr:hypothetical protein YALI1_C17498g [Yarrowia lipolytica]
MRIWFETEVEMVDTRPLVRVLGKSLVRTLSKSPFSLSKTKLQCWPFSPPCPIELVKPSVAAKHDGLPIPNHTCVLHTWL